MPSPEELAREKIDKLLTECGWIIQNRATINLSASRGVAIREALLKDRDEVDYLQATLAQFAEIANDLRK
jgi:type I restriction enzyme R subunit